MGDFADDMRELETEEVVQHMLAKGCTPFDPPFGPGLVPQDLHFPRVSRLELIHNYSREKVVYGVSRVEVCVQDDDRTIKIFYSTED